VLSGYAQAARPLSGGVPGWVLIAQALFVSPGTVRKHLEHIYDKLEARTRTEAAAIYTQERVVMESTGLGPLGARRHSQNRPQS
jgi:hypothetical protein